MPARTRLSFFVLALVLAPPAGAQPAHRSTSAALYPAGDVFPLGLYALRTRQQMESERPAGWNLAHTYYQFGPAYVAMADSAGYHVLANLPGESEALTNEQYITTIALLSELDAVGWWDFPEERRHWVPAEMQLVQALATWTRQHDADRRPRYMYLPGHYRAADVAHYVPYLDILPASVYPIFNDQPHAWTRWRIEETIAGIEEAGGVVGPDYLAGQKTVVAVLELQPEGSGRTPTAAGSYHDFWLSIACGARGVLVSSYAYRASTPALAASWARLQEAAAQISGPEGVGRAFLFGSEVAGVSARVTAGPTRAPAFLPTPTSTAAISFPAVTVAARRYRDDLYLIVVNSAESSVDAEVAGLPIDATDASLPFGDTTVPIANGRLVLAMPALGVQILISRSVFPHSPDTSPSTSALTVGSPRPNPIGQARRTSVPIVVPAGGLVEIRAYDAIGRHVATPFVGTLPAGRHQLDIDLAGMTEGAYALRVNGPGGSSATRLLTLVE